MGEPLTLLGFVLHVSKSNMLIVKCAKKTPRIGEPVYDGSSRMVGSVYDIIGPTASPYIVVKPSTVLAPHDVSRIRRTYVRSTPKSSRRKRK
ncbi:MAG: Gar1/Naf1 family protein [Candidatus Nezhaarchaeota archaeon]|nr:Gar1/Naf1 family protein [Candidatus Nezhaarchaeota archaeon]